MTSQLNVDTIVDKAGSGGPSLPNTTTIKISNTSTNVSDGGAVTQNTVQGLAKVWSSHNMGSSNDSFNSSGITDNGTGDFTLNFTNSFSSANHSATIGGSESNTNANVVITVNQATGYTASSVRHFTISEDTGILDLDAPACHAIHGDLA
tara:strand:+ start:244 stop:693 length:450 start_codon:yes stop_codon:yes gene_type:complete